MLKQSIIDGDPLAIARQMLSQKITMVNIQTCSLSWQMLFETS